MEGTLIGAIALARDAIEAGDVDYALEVLNKHYDDAMKRLEKRREEWEQSARA